MIWLSPNKTRWSLKDYTISKRCPHVPGFKFFWCRIRRTNIPQWPEKIVMGTGHRHWSITWNQCPQDSWETGTPSFILDLDPLGGFNSSWQRCLFILSCHPAVVVVIVVFVVIFVVFHHLALERLSGIEGCRQHCHFILLRHLITLLLLFHHLAVDNS